MIFGVNHFNKIGMTGNGGFMIGFNLEGQLTITNNGSGATTIVVGANQNLTIA